jgi:Dot/Icm secretion system protein IcmQ
MTEDQQAKDRQISQELIDILSNLLDEGDWDASLFLKVSKKRLVALREEAQSLLKQFQPEPVQQLADEQKAVTEGEREVFISLYLGGEATIKRWEQVLKTLGAYSVGRPVYTDEDHARSVLRGRGDRENDAYAAIIVSNSSILPVKKNKQSVDRQGNPLLTLRMGAIQTENITKFVCSKKAYRFDNAQQRLIQSD